MKIKGKTYNIIIISEQTKKTKMNNYQIHINIILQNPYCTMHVTWFGIYLYCLNIQYSEWYYAELSSLIIINKLCLWSALLSRSRKRENTQYEMLNTKLLNVEYKLSWKVDCDYNNIRHRKWFIKRILRVVRILLTLIYLHVMII